jgi:proline racemase/trans-L-3-hydroxyproline dehydratase
MKVDRFFTVVDCHTGGSSVRLVIGGGPKIPGKTMAEKRDYFRENMDHIRQMLTNEPRGHRGVFLAYLVPPARDEADVGLLFMASGEEVTLDTYHDIVGHASISATTALVELGMVAVKEPITEVNIDTPAGLLRARAKFSDGLVDSVTLNFADVPSFFIEKRRIKVPGLGDIQVDVAFGGLFMIFVSEEEIGVKLDKKNINELVVKGMLLKSAAQEQIKLYHPNPSITRVCNDAIIYGPPTNPKAHEKTIDIYGSSSFDRSPSGTTTCCRMATLYAKGKLKLNEEFIPESIVGSLFRGRLIQETKVGEYAAVVPEVTGSAYIYGFSSIVCSVNDPFRGGFYI